MEKRDTWKMDDSLNRADQIGEDSSEVTMVRNDGLIPALPKMFIIDAVSRLSAKDACKLKVLSKEWLSFISSNSEFKRLHRLRAPQRPSLLVLSKVINEFISPGLFVEDDITPLPPPTTGEVEDFGGRTLVFNVWFYLEDLREYVSSCRDLMCFYNRNIICVYSPSTNQYLRFETYNQTGPTFCRLAIVYVASMNLYKIVKLEVHESPLSGATVRFYALTVEDEEDEPQCGRGRRCDVDEHHISEWQFISEHAIPSIVLDGTGGNLIGVGGVVYVIVMFSGNTDERQVLSLGFEENNKLEHNFKMFSLPQTGCDERKCASCYMTKELSQVKDLLCYLHTNTSSIDLWLLKDRYTCTWFKGYTISYMPSPDYLPEKLVYFPYPTTTVFYDDEGAAIDDADAGAGLFLFSFENKLYQYDIRTKESRLLLQENCIRMLHVFSDNLYSLKNGLSCTRMPFIPPPPWMREPRRPLPIQDSKRRMFPPPPPRYLAKRPQISLPPPPTLSQSSLSQRPFISLPPPPPPPQSYLAQRPQITLPPPPPPLPQSSLPPPPTLSQSSLSQQPRISLPPPLQSSLSQRPFISLPPPPPPQSSLAQRPQITLPPPPPPLPQSSHAQRPKISLPPPPPLPQSSFAQRPRISFPPPPPLPQSSLAQWHQIPLPPTIPFNPQNFQDSIHTPIVKKRKSFR